MQVLSHIKDLVWPGKTPEKVAFTHMAHNIRGLLWPYYRDVIVGRVVKKGALQGVVTFPAYVDIKSGAVKAYGVKWDGNARSIQVPEAELNQYLQDEFAEVDWVPEEVGLRASYETRKAVDHTC